MVLFNTIAPLLTKRPQKGDLQMSKVTLPTMKQAEKILASFDGLFREKVQEIIESGVLADLRDGDLNKFSKKARNDFRQSLGLSPLDIITFFAFFYVPSIQEPFVAKEKFRIGNAGIKFISNGFRQFFLEGGKENRGKIEQPMRDQSCGQFVLEESSFNRDIMAEIAKKDDLAPSFTLSGMFFLMEIQANGGIGNLIVGGKHNVFYVPDASKSYKSVACSFDKGWHISAQHIDSAPRWEKGCRVFFVKKKSIPR